MSRHSAADISDEYNRSPLGVAPVSSHTPLNDEQPPPDPRPPSPDGPLPPPPGVEIAGFQWIGEISPQKWMNFYTKVLSRFATGTGLKLTVTVDVDPPGGMGISKVEETKVALRELGFPEHLSIKPKP